MSVLRAWHSGASTCYPARHLEGQPPAQVLASQKTEAKLGIVQATQSHPVDAPVASELRSSPIRQVRIDLAAGQADVAQDWPQHLANRVNGFSFAQNFQADIVLVGAATDASVKSLTTMVGNSSKGQRNATEWPAIQHGLDQPSQLGPTVTPSTGIALRVPLERTLLTLEVSATQT